MISKDEAARQVGELLVALIGLARTAAQHGLDAESTREARASFDQICSVVSRLAYVKQHGVIIARKQNRFFFDSTPLANPGERLAPIAARLAENQAEAMRLILPIAEGELPAVLFLLAAREAAPTSGLATLEWLTTEAVERAERSVESARDRATHLFKFPGLTANADGYGKALDAIAETTAAVVEDWQRGMPDLLKAARDIARGIVDDLEGYLLVTTLPYYERFTVHHSLNVAIHAARAAMVSEPDRGRVERVVEAALLHDLGKCWIPETVLEKSGRLEKHERRMIMEHPVMGARILASHGQVDPLSVSVAFGHRIKDDGQGYPQTPPRYDLGGVTRLVEVCDIFEALTAHRPYKRPITAAQAFEVIHDLPHMTSFRPYLQLLYRGIGPFPIGSRVRLEDGRIGVVSEHPGGPHGLRVRPIQEYTGYRALGDAVDITVTPGADYQRVCALDSEAHLELLEATP